MSRYSEDATIKATARKAKAMTEANEKSQAKTIVEMPIKSDVSPRARRVAERLLANKESQAKGRCEMGCGRPANSEMPHLCIPCYTEAGWENTHSDQGHEGFEALTVKQTNFRTKAALEEWKAEVRKEIEGCWICRPELNKASAEYVSRAGTSRQGMKLSVTLKASGKEKAAEVQAKLPKGYAAKAQNVKGIVTLKAAISTGNGIILRWDANGRFLSGEVQLEGKSRKVRNVAELLRIV
jgi:hypothetical protein